MREHLRVILMAGLNPTAACCRTSITDSLNEGVRDAQCASAQGVVVSTIHGDLLW